MVSHCEYRGHLFRQLRRRSVRADIVGKRLEKVKLPQVKVPDIAALLESLKPPGPPVVTARETPQLPKKAEPPVLPDAGRANPPPKKP